VHRDYPTIDRPIISVSTSYTQALTQILLKPDYTEPLEKQIGRFPGIRSIASSRLFGQQPVITIEFNLGVDLEAA